MVLLDFKPGRSDWRHLPGSFFHISISSFLVYVHFVLFSFVVQSFYHLFHDFQYLFQALVRIKLHCKASAGEPFRLVIDRYIEFTFDSLYDLVERGRLEYQIPVGPLHHASGVDSIECQCFQAVIVDDLFVWR